MSRKKSKKKRNGRLLLVLVMLLIAGVGGFFAYRYYVDDVRPAFTADGTIYVYPEDSFDTVYARIVRVLQPVNGESVRRTLASELEGRELSAGKYSFTRNQTARYAARSVTRGWQTSAKVVLAGRIRTKGVLASKLSRSLMYDSAAFAAAFNDSILLSACGTTPSRLFEMVLPDTYEILWTATPQEVLERFRKEYDVFWNPERRQAAAALKLTPSQVSILASIVCEETNRKEDMPLVASVYLNRLAKGMKLQACPTVCYIYNYELRRVLYRHLRTESPYNTYLHEGLPPTPICVPTKECLEATLHPSNTDYLFFCADSSLNGTSKFASTLREHNRNAAEYSKAIDRYMKRKAAKEKEEAKNF